MSEQFNFHVSVEAETETGRIVAVYFQIREGKSVLTKEFADGKAFADYDRQGRLLGIELLGPCEAEILDRIAKQSKAKKFIRQAAPNSMLVPC